MYRRTILFGMIAWLAGASAQAADKPPVLEKSVAKIDTVIATARGNDLVIQAKGAVNSGGWKMARLRPVKPADPHSVVVEFVAIPPPPASAVIQGLVPIAADARIRMRKGVVTVRVVSDANEITTQILH